MDNKIKFKFSKQINILLLVAVAICVIGIISDIVLLTLAVISKTSYIAYIVSGVILIVLMALLAAIKFGSYYKFEKSIFVFSLFCIKKKIDYNDILNIRYDNVTKQSIVYYNTYTKSGEKLVTYFVLSAGDNLQNIVDKLKDKNNMIIFESFHEENSEEN